MEKRRAGRQYPAGLVAVTAIDLVIYGLVLGVAFASGEQTGLLLSIALAFEVLFLSLSVGAALAVAGTGRARVLAPFPCIASLSEPPLPHEKARPPDSNALINASAAASIAPSVASSARSLSRTAVRI